MIIKRINDKNFNLQLLASFDRTQKVQSVYKYANGEYTSIDTDYIVDWDNDAKIKMSQTLLSDKYIAFGAFDEDVLYGFVIIEEKLRSGRCVMVDIQVTNESRKKGIGSALFNIAKSKAIVLGAKELYMSVPPIVESVDFFRNLECEPTDKPINSIAVVEPSNIQMVCAL
ncbi:MAG: GNAT family N-acetyltransferase [Acutalibacteraceae bacterium]|nr:GNAT family N-acetyltransferase [Acutalibacteraceae bacterium]